MDTRVFEEWEDDLAEEQRDRDDDEMLLTVIEKVARTYADVLSSFLDGEEDRDDSTSNIWSGCLLGSQYIYRDASSWVDDYFGPHVG